MKALSNQGWKEIDGKKFYFRSKWEANYAKYLQFLKVHNQIKEWEHEPQTFWFEGIKRGVVSYLPDFKITRSDGTHYWIEVKGWLDPRSNTKIKRFAKYFPEEKLIVIDSKWFSKNNKQMKFLIKTWE